MNYKLDPKVIEDRKREIAERRSEFLSQRLNSETSLVYKKTAPKRKPCLVVPIKEQTTYKYKEARKVETAKPITEKQLSFLNSKLGHLSCKQATELIRVVIKLGVYDPGMKFEAPKDGSYYVAIIGGKVRTYANWSDCKREVDGRRCFFKKVASKAEEDQWVGSKIYHNEEN